MYVCMIPEDWSFVIDFEKIVYVFIIKSIEIY